MVGITLFDHEHPIHAHVNISKDGVAKIVDAVGVSGIVGIGNGQVGFQSLIPTHRIGQTYFDLKTEFVEIVTIVQSSASPSGRVEMPRPGRLRTGNPHQAHRTN